MISKTSLTRKMPSLKMKSSSSAENTNHDNEFNEKFLEHVSTVVNHFADDFKITEEKINSNGNAIHGIIEAVLFKEHQILFPNYQLTKEEIERIFLINQILNQKRRELNRNTEESRVDIQILNLYGFQVVDDTRKIFKIPIFQIMNSNYESAFVLWNGLTFNNSHDIFNFIENMPSSKLCVPSQYKSDLSCEPLIIKNEILLFNTKNTCQNCFNECIMEIDFINFIETFKALHLNNDINEKIFKLVQKLLSTIETYSSETTLDIGKLLKVETFVHTVIVWRIIEKLDLTWERPLTSWRSVSRRSLEKMRHEVVNELFYKITEDWIYERFKKYYTNERSIILVDGSEGETICTLQLNGTEKFDLDPFLKEICNVEYKIYDNITSTFNWKTISFDNNTSCKIIFHEVIPECVLGCAIVKNSDGFFKNEEKILPAKMPFNNIISPNDEMEIEIFKNLGNLSENEIKELENFFEKTTMEQEFIARTQGHFNPRILLKRDEDHLKKFVKIVIFGLQETNNWENLSEKDKDKMDKMINGIAAEIIKKAGKFGKIRDDDVNAIFYDAVQLFGYKRYKDLGSKVKKVSNQVKNVFKKKGDTKDENFENIYKLSLFKVYRNATDDKPIIIDVDCNEYDDWNTFLERNVLATGDCLCVPKDGRYINELRKKIEVEYLINTPKYWTPTRTALVGVNTALFVGSTALAFYSGPIGWGVRAITLTTPVRFGIAGVGIGSSSIGLGVTLCKKGLFIRNNFQSFAPNLISLLNITSDIVVLFGETSIFAEMAYMVLVPTAIVLSISLAAKLIFEAAITYRQKGKLEGTDYFEIANALFLTLNSIIKIGDLTKIITSYDWTSKMPLFGKLPALNKVKMARDTLDLKQLVRFSKFAHNTIQQTNVITVVQDFIISTYDYFKRKKTVQEFKTDFENFAMNLIEEIAKVIEPQVNSFLQRKFKITLKDLTGTDYPISKSLREYIPMIFIFVLKMIEDGKKVLRELKRRFGFDRSNEEKIEDLAQALGEQLAIEGPCDPMSNIDKIMRAEEFIRSTVFKKVILKLKSLVGSEETIRSELMEDVMKNVIEEIKNDVNQSDFKTKFEEYCSDYKNLILLEEDESSKVYVFQYETEDDLKTVVREEGENIESQLRKVEENIFTYEDENKTVVIFSDSDGPNNRLGFMVICYNDNELCNLNVSVRKNKELHRN